MKRSELAEAMLISWCANPQMFSEGQHVPYESLIRQAYIFADMVLEARIKGGPCREYAASCNHDAGGAA